MVGDEPARGEVLQVARDQRVEPNRIARIKVDELLPYDAFAGCFVMPSSLAGWEKLDYGTRFVASIVQ